MLIIAIVGSGAYYLGTRNKTASTSSNITENTSLLSNSQTEVNLNIPIIPPSSEKQNVQPSVISSNKKTYISKIFNVQFEYPKEWYVYEKLRYGGDFTFLKDATRPKDAEPCDCDADLYNSLARIYSYDLLETQAESKKTQNSSLFYKGINQQIVNDDNVNYKVTYSYALKEAEKVGVTLNRTFYINKNGLRVVKQYIFSEIGASIGVRYYVYLGDKVYMIVMNDSKEYNTTDDATLGEIANSFKVKG